MSDSNNIYNILGKLEALKPTAQEKHDATVKAIYESVEAQGSITAGVSSVESKLRQQFAESKTDEGVIGNIKNTIRSANYDRLANRSNSQAVAGGGFAPPAQFKALSAKGDDRAQKAQDIRKAVDDRKALDNHAGHMFGPAGVDYNNLKANYKESTCNECNMPMESCGCTHTNEGIGDSIKMAWGKAISWVLDKAISISKDPVYKKRAKELLAQETAKAEQLMLSKIAGHPREEQLKQQVHYIVTQLNQQTTMSGFINTAQKLFTQLQAEREKFSETDMPTASPADEPAGSPGEPQGTVTVSADPDSGHIDPSEYIEEAGDFGQQINDLFGQVYDYGDAGLDYLDNNAPFWTALFDKHDGDIDAIIANEPDDILTQAVEELEGVVSDLPYELSEAEITRKSGVTTHRKTDFPGYPADDINDPDVEPTDRKRGRPRKHAAKAPTGLGRGRPVKAKAPTFSKQADPFGRVTGKVPAGKKGTVHTMAESMNRLGARLIEGINFSNMMKETDQTIDELMNELQNDIKEYKATGHCSDKLKDFMQVHAHSKKQMADETVAPVAPKPMAPAGGIHGNFMDPMSAKDQQAKMNPPRTLEDVTMEEELNELAKLAGLGEATRGEHIKQKDAEAEKSGKDKFTAFGQEFDTDKVEEEETDEGNTFGNEVRKAKADGIQPGEKIEVNGETYPVKESTSFDGKESSDFNINTSMSSNGDKNVTVSATGEHAASLLQMLRIAGLGGGDKAQELQAEPSVEVIALDNEEGIEEESIDVDQPKVVAQNAPNEKYGTIKNITTQGDDLNRQKRQDPTTANKAANPMTNAQNVLKSVAQLESKLAEEYESIKKVSK